LQSQKHKADGNGELIELLKLRFCFRAGTPEDGRHLDEVGELCGVECLLIAQYVAVCFLEMRCAFGGGFIGFLLKVTGIG
jgi:hypothetical protein